MHALPWLGTHARPAAQQGVSKERRRGDVLTTRMQSACKVYTEWYTARPGRRRVRRPVVAFAMATVACRVALQASKPLRSVASRVAMAASLWRQWHR